MVGIRPIIPPQTSDGRCLSVRDVPGAGSAEDETFVAEVGDDLGERTFLPYHASHWRTLSPPINNTACRTGSNANSTRMVPLRSSFMFW